MNWKTRPWVIATLLILLPFLVASCAQFEVTERSIAYNQSVADAQNSQILLNAVRASRRYPMHFDEISIVRGKSPVEGSVGLKVPFGGDANDVFELTPSLTASSGTDFEQPTLDTQEFFRGVLDPVPPEMLKLYLDAGWPKELVQVVFINQIELPEQMHNNIESSFNSHCDTERIGESDIKLCKIVREESKRCELPEAKSDKVAYRNLGRDRCDFVRFQTFLRKINLLDVSFKSVTEPISKTVKKTTTKETTTSPMGKALKEITVSEIEIEEITDIVLKFPEKFNFSEKITTKLTESNLEAVEDDKGQLRLRSPQGMIFFLGELIAAQTRLTEGKKYTPQVIIGQAHTPVDLFKVSTEASVARTAAVSVTHEGIRYSIPQPELVAEKPESRSLQTLALVKQVIGQQKSREDLPSASAVTIIGGS